MQASHTNTPVEDTQPKLDLLAKENLRNPYPMFRRFLAEAPIHFDEGSKVWIISRYADILSLLKNSALSADRYDAIANAVPDEHREMNAYIRDCLSLFLLNIEGEKHLRLRSLAKQSFRPKIVSTMKPFAEQIVADLLDAVEPKGTMDVVSDLAYPMPIQFIFKILGVYPDDVDHLKKLSDDISIYIGSAGKAKDCIPPAYNALVEFTEMFQTQVEARRREPKDDLISAMVTTQVEGDYLSDKEVVANCILLLVSGFETVTNLLASGTLALLEHPEQMQRLRKDPSLMSGAIEECLRYYPPVNRTARLCVEDIEIGGQTIEKGQLVILLLGAGNRDPERYENPDVFDITRDPNIRNLSFGAGAHFCIGARQARLEASVAFEALFTRMPKLRANFDAIKWRGGSRFRGLESLPVHF